MKRKGILFAVIGVVAVLVMLAIFWATKETPAADDAAPTGVEVDAYSAPEDAPVRISIDSCGSSSMQLTVTNQGSEEYMFGEWFALDRLEGDVWEGIPYLSGEDTAVWSTVGYPVAAGKSRPFSINWHDLYGTLPAGHYRVKKSCFPSSNVQEDVMCYAEFILD